MLKKIRLKNFQSHKDTELVLDEKITAITGTSDAGKSSILRAIKFLATNRPRGTAFISHNKTKTEVQLEFDGTTISRKRGKSINNYELGNQSFNVVKSDVPDEVTQFLNFAETTIQSQHDKYFLLQNTAGEVAKKLNKVANLDIIDHVMREVNSDITENKRAIQYTQGRINDLEKDIEEYEHLDEVETLLAGLLEKMTQHTELGDSWWEIDQACRKIESTEETIENLDSWLQIEEPFIEIVRSCKELRDWLIAEQDLTTVIEEVVTSEERIKSLSEQAGHEETVKGILRYGSESGKLTVSLFALEELMYNMELEKEIIAEKEQDIEDLTRDAVNLIQENKLCPLCGGKIGENVLDHVREWI
jgi:exonuclease SbcC